MREIESVTKIWFILSLTIESLEQSRFNLTNFQSALKRLKNGSVFVIKVTVLCSSLTFEALNAKATL